MAVNAIFKTNNLASIQSERNLYSDLIKEAIQIYGHDVYYMDRTLVARDNVMARYSEDENGLLSIASSDKDLFKGLK